jgi:hypothetical protein
MEPIFEIMNARVWRSEPLGPRDFSLWPELQPILGPFLFG